VSGDGALLSGDGALLSGDGALLSVEAGLFADRRLAGLAAAAASLPRLLRPAAGAPADIRVVDGAAPDWSGALARALDAAPRGVLLSAPAVVPAAEVDVLAARAARARCPVVVAAAFCYDPAVRDGLSRLRADGETFSLFDSMVTIPDYDSAGPLRSRLGRGFLAQLTAIRTITGPVPPLTVDRVTDEAYSAAGTRDGVTVLLAGVVSALPAVLRVDLVGARRRHTICLAEPAAAPAAFGSYGASGLVRPPPSYEGGLRGAWRALYAAVTSAQPVRFGLPELALDLAAAAAWRTAGPGG